MSKQVMILHGWSDTASSFRELAGFLHDNGYETTPLYLGDYVSMYDDVSIDDVVKRMDEVIRERMKLPVGDPERLGPRFHVIVHSTGGLVIRRWIANRCRVGKCPVDNLLMLAPANFGSVLAHKGRSMIGRIFKGYKTWLQTGAEMLYALELGSPFQWDLARSDLFACGTDDAVLYGPERVRPFVIVGSHGYTGGRGLMNENGSDGTVRVSAANMNARGMTVDFSGDVAHLTKPKITRWPLRGGDDLRFPLAVLPDRDHTSIKQPLKPGHARKPEDRRKLAELIIQALKVKTPAQYANALKEWDTITLATRRFAGRSDEMAAARRDFFQKDSHKREFFHEHYQIVFRAIDEFGAPIDDYFIEFMPAPTDPFPDDDRPDLLDLSDESAFFQTDVLAHKHRHAREKANRTLYIDRYDMMRAGGFYDILPQDRLRTVAFHILAHGPGNRVRYFSQDRKKRQGLIHLHDRQSAVDRWLKRHCTHFIEMIVPRAGRENLFKLDRYEK